jgi:hypothetical protein
MYFVEDVAFQTRKLTRAQEHLAETEVNWPETLWIIPWELVEARKLVKQAEAELEEAIWTEKYEAEQKAEEEANRCCEAYPICYCDPDQCCPYSFCDCNSVCCENYETCEGC